jgi:hypothetical protein
MAEYEYVSEIVLSVLEKCSEWSSEIDCKDYRGSLELHVGTPEQMDACICMVQMSGWKDNAYFDPQRLLVGVEFDLSSPETGPVRVLISLRDLNEWAQRYWEGDRQTRSPVPCLTKALNEFVHGEKSIGERIAMLIRTERLWLSTRGYDHDSDAHKGI